MSGREEPREGSGKGPCSMEILLPPFFSPSDFLKFYGGWGRITMTPPYVDMKLKSAEQLSTNTRRKGMPYMSKSAE